MTERRARLAAAGVQAMRIFIGLSEIANCVNTYGKAFRELGFRTLTVVGHRAWAYPDSTYDVVLSEDLGTPPERSGRFDVLAMLRRQLWRLRFYLLFAWAVLTCDVFIFVFGSSFRADRRDYWLLKKLRKRIVSVFLGSDTRYWYAYVQEAELIGTDSDIRPYLDEGVKGRAHDYLAVKLATVRDAERYSDLILAMPDAAQLQTRPYMRVNIPIDLSRIECFVPDRAVPIVVHAPSVRSIKGTEHVLAAVEQLRREGIAFDFRLIEGLPNTELCQLLRDADIVVDQLYGETVATLALEGLAAGNVVLARYLPDRVRIGADCPVVNINVVTLQDRLREVIVDRELRRRLATAGRRYVELYHSHLVVARQILDWLDPKRRGEFHFHPTFFRDHFTMSPALAQREAELLRSEPLYVRVASLPNLPGVRFREPGVDRESEPIVHS
jgi:glycosyltransferase involved in cell wall biosynthesis